MDRRKFLAQSCGACAAVSLGLIFSSFLLESCASTGLSVLKTSAEGGKVKVPMADFAQNNFKLIRVADYNYDIGVQKKEDGSFLAMVLMCTHARHPLTKAGNGYYCTLHGSKFSGDGKVEKGPASRPMVHLATEITGDDLIIIL
jgi:Rieske Fe-S protein